MKKGIAIITLIWVISTIHIFADARIFRAEGGKFAYSTSKLKEKDFEGSNFFLTDSKNPYYKDLNVQIFNLIKSSEMKNSEVSPWVKDIVGKKKGEVIYFWGTSNYLINYSIWDKKIKEFVTYTFYLELNKEAYESRSDDIAYYDKCIKGMDYCNWVLENCANRTIRKARKIQVPYTYQERIWNPGHVGANTYHLGSTEGSTGYEEVVTRTAYREEIEYYDEANPNYDPAKVAKAKTDLSYWQTERARMEEKLRYLPFWFKPVDISDYPAENNIGKALWRAVELPTPV